MLVTHHTTQNEYDEINRPRCISYITRGNSFNDKAQRNETKETLEKDTDQHQINSTDMN